MQIENKKILHTDILIIGGGTAGERTPESAERQSAADQPRARQRGARTEAEKGEAGVHRTLFGGKGLSVSGRKEAH